MNALSPSKLLEHHESSAGNPRSGLDHSINPANGKSLFDIVYSRYQLERQRDGFIEDMNVGDTHPDLDSRQGSPDDNSDNNIELEFDPERPFGDPDKMDNKREEINTDSYTLQEGLPTQLPSKVLGPEGNESDSTSNRDMDLAPPRLSPDSLGESGSSPGDASIHDRPAGAEGSDVISSDINDAGAGEDEEF